MSDEISDDSFVSADEGSEFELNCLKPDSGDILGSDDPSKSIPAASLIDVVPTKIKSTAQDSQQDVLVDAFSSYRPGSDSVLKDIISDAHVPSLFSDSFNFNPNEVSRGKEKHSLSLDANQPLINFEEKIDKNSTDTIGVIHTEKTHVKSDCLGQQISEIGEIDNDVEAWDLKDDQWESTQKALTEGPQTKLPESSSTSKIKIGFLDGKSLKTVTSLQSDAWNSKGNVLTGFQTLEAENHSSKIYMTGASNFESRDNLVDVVNMETAAPSLETGTWDLKDDPWTDLPILATESRPIETPNSQLRNKPNRAQQLGSKTDSQTDLHSLKAFQENNASAVKEPKINAKPLHAEKVDIWDLQDDPWTCSEVEECGIHSASDNVNAYETTQKSHINNDDWNAEIEEEWDNVEDLQEKPSVNASQELASAATALVKSVGGGLASFVGGFKLSNLSSTLAAFEEKVATETPMECMQQLSQPETSQLPSNVDHAVSATTDCDESATGWGFWNLGSLAKSFTSTVENTGLQIIHGGVDALEQIGRKTFTALKENDPGLVYTKRFLRPVDSNQVPKLSQVLREASDQHTARLPIEPHSGEAETHRGDLASQLESRLALVHMEALELLSSRASARLGTRLARLQAFTDNDDEEHRRSFHSLTIEGGVLERIWQTLQLKDKEAKNELTEETSVSKITISKAAATLETIISGVDLLKTFKQVHQTSQNLESDLPIKEIFYRAIGALADTTSAILAYLHKLAERLLLLGQSGERFNLGFLDLAENVANLLAAAKRENGTLCSTYVQHLKTMSSSRKADKVDGETDEVSTENRRLVVVLFVETEMANGYLDDAAGNYLVSVVQVACLDAFFPDSTSAPVSRHPKVSLKAKQR